MSTLDFKSSAKNLGNKDGFGNLTQVSANYLRVYLCVILTLLILKEGS